MSLITVCGRDVRVQGHLVRIARLELDKYDGLDDPEELFEGLRVSGSRIDLFTFMQVMPDTTPKYSYPIEWDNLAVLPISTFEYWWEKQIRSFPRNRARQAEKRGVILREISFDDTLVRGIWAVYNETPVRQGRPNTHYGKDIATVRSEAATYLDRSHFIGAFLEDQLIGFVKLVTNESRTQANLMNIVSMIRHRDKAPTNALIAHAVKCCAKNHISHLVYQSFTYAKRQPDSLTTFKEVNGFKRVELPRYYVPLSPIGGAALRLGLHHPLADRIPESVSAKLRELRSAWYNRRFHSAADVA